jgi:hypothetical protein
MKLTAHCMPALRLKRVELYIHVSTARSVETGKKLGLRGPLLASLFLKSLFIICLFGSLFYDTV